MKALVKIPLILSLVMLIACGAMFTSDQEGSFRYSICEPLNPEIIEKGEISPDKIIEVFEEFPWDRYLTDIANARGQQVYYSPSLEFENTSNKYGILASAVGNPGNFEFYLFFKRPKNGGETSGNVDDSKVSNLMGQTKEDAIACLKALIKNDRTFLEAKFQ